MTVALLWDDTRREHGEQPELLLVFKDAEIAMNYKLRKYPDAVVMDYYVTTEEVHG